jgi:hypothetical protein
MQRAGITRAPASPAKSMGSFRRLPIAGLAAFVLLIAFAPRRPRARLRSKFANTRSLPAHIPTTSHRLATAASGTRHRARVSSAGSTRRAG